MQAWGLQSLKIGVVTAFLGSILAGIFLPVYTDEVGWRFQERAGFDGIDKMFSDMCGPSSLARPPFFMMPVRYFSSFFNAMFADPLYVRLSGISYAFIWALLVLRLVAQISSNRAERDALAIVGFGLMGLGVLPLLLIWSRPEQPILLATTAAIIVACIDRQNPDAATMSTAAWRRSIGILLLASIAMSYHLKGVILVPLFLACIMFASRGRKAHLPRLVTGILLMGAALAATRYWQHRFECPGDPVLAAKYIRHNLGAQLLEGGGGLRGLLVIFKNVSLLDYVRLAVPAANPMSQWLPPDQLSRAASWIWFRVLSFVWMAALLAGLVCLVVAVVEQGRQRRFDRKIALSVVLFGSVMAWSATQLIRNVYEASFVLPLVMLALLLALSGPADRRYGKWLAILAASLGVLAIGSEILIATTYAPSLGQSFRQKAYIRQQPYSVPVFGYAALKPDILGAASQCGITRKNPANALMVDDLTYFAFMRSYRPQHRLGVLSIWNGSITDPIAYLRGRGSDGIIVGCHFLSDDLRRRARRQGEFCCLGPPRW